MDYKETLNLPKTEFPMRANLPVREPEILEKWENTSVYREMVEKNRDREKFILHDGPPYANGHIHMGHALNKILKDIIVKFRNISGERSEYVPGWDCHGLPIEHQVDKNLGEEKDTILKEEKRVICRKYADKFINIQREEFKRLGVFGDWDHPYTTMNYGYEAVILRELGHFVEQGSVYRGVKPVYWCKECRTALAEAEVEYHDHPSPSIFVKFPFTGDPSVVSEKLTGKRVFFVIWTTTPWTIPSNLAIALHPDFEYSALGVGEEVYIVASGLVEKFAGEGNIGSFKILDTFKPGKLERLTCRHPLYERDSMLVLANYVTLDAGTGCVHTAPGHGREDYETGIKYGLDIYAPVDDYGRFTEEVEYFKGIDVFHANSSVTEKLREEGSLIRESTLSHSYPHCWRCKEPLIFRATNQWFISMEETGLRKKALDEIHKVRWIPSWGQNRIESMIETRPDWCISRQRAWGVPITAVKCKGCETVSLDPGIIYRAADAFQAEGADAWFTKDVSEFTAEFECPSCSGRDFEKEIDILDVWFDSGVSFAAVCEGKENLGIPVNLYLEGSDQHRGWFHSALLTAAETRGFAPYKAVLTHGFVVDGQGKKMSKSLGNYIAPEKIIKKYGAEILRLWVIAEDYRDDIRISEEILARVSEAYRKIRNTIRFLLSNLYDFNPEEDSLEMGELEELDRYALCRLSRLIELTRSAYDDYEFHMIFHSVHNFCVVNMSNFYLDVIKDRLYATGRESRERRSAQTALFQILRSLLVITAPVISFTAEEAWSFTPPWKGKNKSVFLEDFPAPFQLEDSQALEKKFSTLLSIKEDVSKALEEVRKSKIIGHSLDALVTLDARGDRFAFIAENIPLLRDMLIVSRIGVQEGGLQHGVAGSENPDILISVSMSGAKKCERCWKYDHTVGSLEDHPTICSRCRETIG